MDPAARRSPDAGSIEGKDHTTLTLCSCFVHDATCGLQASAARARMGQALDRAGQFALFVHGLCGVHAERPLQHLLPLNELDRRAIEWIRQQVWTL